MRTFAVATTEDDREVLDTILIDPETGDITFGIGAAEDLFDELAPLDGDGLTVDEVIARIDGWSNDRLTIDEVPADQVAGILSGLARAEFNKKHDRGRGGLFAKKGTPKAPSTAEVKSAVTGDSGGIEETGKIARPPVAPPPSQIDRAKQLIANAEKMHGSDRSKWSQKDQAAAKKLDALIAAEKTGHTPPKPRMERGAVAKAIATGQPDALADFKRPALMREAKKRNLIVGSRLTDQDLRDLLLDNAGVPEREGPKPKTVAAALRAGDESAVRGFSEKALAAEFKKRGLIGDVSKLDREELADLLLDSSGPDKPLPDLAKELHAAPLTADGEKQVRDKIAHLTLADLKKLRGELGGTVSKSGKTKKEIQDDIVRGTVGFKRNFEAMRGGPTSSADLPKFGKPVTSKMNAHSLTKGDMIIDGGQTYTVKGHRIDNSGDELMVELQLEDAQGKTKTIRKKVNQPVERLQGGRNGGAGTFALDLDTDTVFGTHAIEVLALAQQADLFEFGLAGAELSDFNDKHPRGMGGRFGHSTGLFHLLKAKTAKAGDPDGDHGMWFNGAGSDIPDAEHYARSFDWQTREKDNLVRGGQVHVLDITGPSLVDEEYDETGNEIVSQEFEEKTVRLHLSDGDMRGLANFIGAQLARAELQKQPFDKDDPRVPYLIAMMDLQPPRWQPEDTTYDETFGLYQKGDGSGGWTLSAVDDDGDEVGFEMSADELDALYGQLASYLLTPRGLEAPTQTAAVSWVDEVDGWMREWAAHEFDVSMMPERLQEYWTEGEGAAKVRWGTRGAFRRCRRALVKEGVPLRMVNGACANLYKRATGKHPGPHGRRNRTGPGRAMALGTSRILIPAQTACAACGDDQLEVSWNDDYDGPVPENTTAPSTSTGWRGPLAPIDVATGDRRRFAADALMSRQLPLPFRWQEEQKSGHDGAVVVGAMTGYSILEDSYTMPNGVVLDPGTIMGEGYFLDPAVIPQSERARYLVEHGLIGPSVDLEPNMEVAFRDDAGNTFDPHECAAEGTCPAKPEALITSATITGATLVPITAFAEARAPQLFDRTVADDMAVMGNARPSCGCTGSQVASVRANGWDDLPFADRDVEWDKGAANSRLVAWAKGDDGEVDLDKYGRAFLWHDDVSQDDLTQGSFKLPIADVVGGQLTIIPRAVFAVANRLGQADIPAAAKQDIRGVVEDLYDQMADEFDDDELHAPWDTTSHEMALAAGAEPPLPAEGCGCAEKWAKSAAAYQTAASVFEGMDPYPADAFKVKSKGLTPMTVEERPGESFSRIYGHIASWSSCNRGYRGQCVPPPRSRTGYANFHLGQVRTTEGPIPAGKIVMGEGHPDTGAGVRVARAFYDATSKQVAWGVMTDDEHGPFFSGVLAPGVTAQEAATFLMSPPSGDWKDFELMAVLAVNVPGHVVPRATMVDGRPANMVAAGRWLAHDHDDLDDVVGLFDRLAWEDEAAGLAAAFN